MAQKTQTVETKVVDPVEKELDALRTVLTALDSVQSETRQRMFDFLKSRYRDDWPYSD